MARRRTRKGGAHRTPGRRSRTDRIAGDLSRAEWPIRLRMCTETDHSACARRCDNCVHLSSMDIACPMTIGATDVWRAGMDWADVEHHLTAADPVEVNDDLHRSRSGARTTLYQISPLSNRN